MVVASRQATECEHLWFFQIAGGIFGMILARFHRFRTAETFENS